MKKSISLEGTILRFRSLSEIIPILRRSLRRWPEPLPIFTAARPLSRPPTTMPPPASCTYSLSHHLNDFSLNSHSSIQIPPILVNLVLYLMIRDSIAWILKISASVHERCLGLVFGATLSCNSRAWDDLAAGFCCCSCCCCPCCCFE